eukprot:1152509-Pelagomonas_calceolata.AAC.2
MSAMSCRTAISDTTDKAGRTMGVAKFDLSSHALMELVEMKGDLQPGRLAIKPVDGSRLISFVVTWTTNHYMSPDFAQKVVRNGGLVV